MEYDFLLERDPETEAVSCQHLLYVNLRHAIANGRLGPMHRLPSSRELAEELDIARNTVIYAYEQLCAEGYLLSNRRGTLVAPLPALPHRSAATPPAMRLSRRVRQLPQYRPAGDPLRPFTPGVPALDAFPLLEWQSAQRKASRETQPRDLAYGAVEGVPVLRAAISDRLRAARGLRCTPDQVLITDGTQAAIEICAKLLTEDRDIVWMESPGYSAVRWALSTAGLTLHPVAADEDGMRTDGLPESPAPRLIYLTPSHQYPMGGVLSLARRYELIVLARKHRAWILEDDYDSDFRYDGAPLAALQGLVEDAPVIYIGTFSKTLFPGLRLGYLIVPAALVAPMRSALGHLMRCGRQVEQAALARFMTEGRYTRHLSRMRKLYKERQRALRAALARHLPKLEVLGARAGLHLVLLLPADIDDVALCDRARQHGLNPQPLSSYYGNVSNKQSGLVLGFGNTPADTINRHVRALAACLA